MDNEEIHKLLYELSAATLTTSELKICNKCMKFEDSEKKKLLSVGTLQLEKYRHVTCLNSTLTNKWVYRIKLDGRRNVNKIKLGMLLMTVLITV